MTVPAMTLRPPTTNAKNRYTSSTEAARGIRRAQNARTMGFSRMAISAATTNTNTAWLTAEISNHTPTIASGRPTS